MNLEAIKSEMRIQAVRSYCAFLDVEEDAAVALELKAIEAAKSVAELRAVLPAIARYAMARVRRVKGRESAKAA